jgi:ankyrin repeat protein
VYENRPVIAELLVANGCNMGALDDRGRTALELCDITPNSRDVKAVLAVPRTPLLMASGSGDLKRVEELIEEGCDINEQSAYGMTAIHAAAKYGRLACAEFLIYEGARLDIIDDSGRTALDYPDTRASIQGMKDMRTRRRWALAAATTHVLPVELRTDIAHRANLLRHG